MFTEKTLNHLIRVENSLVIFKEEIFDVDDEKCSVPSQMSRKYFATENTKFINFKDAKNQQFIIILKNGDVRVPYEFRFPCRCHFYIHF